MLDIFGHYQCLQIVSVRKCLLAYTDNGIGYNNFAYIGLNSKTASRWTCISESKAFYNLQSLRQYYLVKRRTSKTLFPQHFKSFRQHNLCQMSIIHERPFSYFDDAVGNNYLRNVVKTRKRAVTDAFKMFRKTHRGCNAIAFSSRP